MLLQTFSAGHCKAVIQYSTNPLITLLFAWLEGKLRVVTKFMNVGYKIYFK